ncbi:MAG: type I DNA topoisomerase [Alphaproteobacteria bacterium]
MTKALVIVESPAKAATINRYLGPGYKVLASYGHIRDLPPKDGSVRPDDAFEMDWEITQGSEKNIRAIGQALRDADALYLATDPDREGEAISWHVYDELERRKLLDKIDVKRVVFYEVTKGAVIEAIEHPRELDSHLIDAYKARRALDYLVGFTLSPVLWRKLPGARSAGRVQSVALRLICDREAEIEAFRPQEYWTVEVDLETEKGERFAARLARLNGAKLDKFDLNNSDKAEAARRAIEAASFTVANVEEKRVRRNPAPPFTTSTLQQEASRKLGFTARRTMKVAQELYEGISLDGEQVGLITYMRTDSVQLSKLALDEARDVIRGEYGAAYLPDGPRHYRSTAKNAQEAHEAIRPTALARKPRAVAASLSADQARLYELVWKRTLACQMPSAEFDQVGIDIDSPDGTLSLRATGSILAFDGFLKVYQEGRDDDGDDESERRLPPLKVGDAPRRLGVRPEQHFTEPPPRYTEASLVKKLEELGIGRPSTYASIISVLQDRSYVRFDKKRFVPEDRGRVVTSFLENFFKRYVEYGFTAALEDQLDQISAGEIGWREVLTDFWADFKAAVEETGHLRVKDVLEALDAALAPHLFPPGADGRDPRVCPACGEGRLSLKLGRYGPFIGCSAYPECRYTRPLVDGSGENGEAAAEVAAGPKPLGDDPASGLAVTLRKGPYGFYVQLGEASEAKGAAKPKRVSLPRELSPDAVDLDRALGLLSLPREVGKHPESGEPIMAGIGRFGPYVVHQKVYKSLPKDEDVLTIGLNRAVALIAEGKRGGAKVLRELGAHPEDGAPVELKEGRYGPYVQHKRIMATVPKGTDPDALTLEAALALVAAKAAKKGPARGRRARAAAPAAKPTAKPTAKPAAKRKPAKKGAAGRRAGAAQDGA